MKGYSIPSYHNVLHLMIIQQLDKLFEIFVQYHISKRYKIDEFLPAQPNVLHKIGFAKRKRLLVLHQV